MIKHKIKSPIFWISITLGGLAGYLGYHFGGWGGFAAVIIADISIGIQSLIGD